MKKSIHSSKTATVETFSLSDPIAMLDRAEIINYFESSMVYEKYYSPPVDFTALSKSFNSTSHHASALEVKKNILLSTCRTTALLSNTELEKFVQDFLVFGNAYLYITYSKTGKPLKLTAPLAKYVRKGIEAGTYYQLTNSFSGEYEFPKDSVFHLFQPDINQQVYGLPKYIAALQSAYLNEAATLFRRKYYLNGAHAGSIIYLNGSIQNKADIDNIREQIKAAKGKGNFKNLFVHLPDGAKDGIQVIPLSDIVAKDEFLNIKNTSRDDVLAAHRVPPQLMGIIPMNTGGFGSVEDAAKIFFINEIQPLQQRLEEINHYIGQEVISFKEYALLNQ